MCLLVKEFPLVFSPTLASRLGLKQAIFLQQLHYWIVKKKKKRPDDPQSIWVYNTARQWCDQLPFLSKKSFWRLITDLKQKNLLLVSNQNRFKFDKTNWYSLDYQKIDSFLNLPSSTTAPLPSPSSPFDPFLSALMTDPIPKTTTETTHRSISLSQMKPSFSSLSTCKKKDLPSNVSSRSGVSSEAFIEDSIEDFGLKQGSENVFLSKSQVVFLLKKYNKTLLKKFIKKLSLYKWSSGKTYACDFAAILSWVVTAVLKEQQALKKKSFPKNQNQDALKRYLQKNSFL